MHALRVRLAPRHEPLLKAGACRLHARAVGNAKAAPRAELRAPGQVWFETEHGAARLAGFFHGVSLLRAGLGTVPYCAVKLGRRGRGCELSAPYWKDSIWYCREAEAELSTPSLFDFEKEAA